MAFTIFCRSLSALALLVATAACASAQTQPIGARPSIVAPSSMVLDTARAVVGTRVLAAPATSSPEPADPVHHMPAALGGWRIEGETGWLQWPLYLTADEAGSAQRFRIGYRPSATLLPQLSTLTLSINEIVIARIGIASPLNAKPAEFDIPPGVLRRGFNAVRISVEQRHGVDCALDATYELWTEVIPQQTGLISIRPERQAPPDLNDLAALRPRADGMLPIDVVFAERLKLQRIEQVLLASQAIALVGQFRSPIIRFTTSSGLRDGVKLIVGTRSEIASAVNFPADQESNGGPSIFFLSGQIQDAPTLVVTGFTEADVAAAIVQLSSLASSEPIGTPSGLRAAANQSGLKIYGGEHIRLGDVGISNVEFSGRSFRTALDVAMPADFIPADYAKLTIDLAGGYAAGLSAESQVMVAVNGRDAASVGLPNPSGDVFRHNEILVPLGFLRPGANRIEILAQVPNKSDVACDAGALATRNSKRFLLLSSTEIRFPAIARSGRLPDLTPTAASGFPYAQAAAQPNLYVPLPNRESLSAAVTLAVRMAAAAETLIPFAVKIEATGKPISHTLMVAPARALDPIVMKAIGLHPDLVRRGWADRVHASESIRGETRNGDVLPTVVRPSESNSPVDYEGELVTGALPDDVGDRWAAMISQRSAWNWIRQTAAALMTNTGRYAQGLFSSLKSSTGNLDQIDPLASLIIAQGYLTASDNELVTIVTAPSSADLMQTVERVVDPQRWSRLRGRMSVLDRRGNLLESTEASTLRYVATQPFMLRNAGLVAAGWFSLNPGAYLLIALLLASLLAAVTLTLIRHSGRSNG
ncbi:cellulose biosynthesis cyclic di-GMP-binding regulatory protein BcsB [Tardiphaga sp. vice154]|uniref:cellulose biosynthesis cyclic di-GMP-binding regulatory protein BcsB n=1 Tax=Tardiphaga sp. vice154 TaxID=2592814 RepID=UPI00143CE7B1|nr:cellulose biosynthesis cyclic di-GMP-binding regulatory protein BcsB [Tardiphaga sp. vice154]